MPEPAACSGLAARRALVSAQWMGRVVAGTVQNLALRGSAISETPSAPGERRTWRRIARAAHRNPGTCRRERNRNRDVITVASLPGASPEILTHFNVAICLLLLSLWW